MTKEKKSKILLIYTGGTIGMVHHEKRSTLKPINFKNILKLVPELSRLNCVPEYTSLLPLIDSSQVSSQLWIRLAQLVEKNYSKYDGFVILHGSDTMAYTASALSFMFENLAKPVILTGSQLPMGQVRTDARENLISAIEIAGLRKNGKALVPEVCIYFEYRLLRGNRSTKFSSNHFEAFRSIDYPPLAEAGVHLMIDEKNLLPNPKGIFKVHTGIEEKVGLFTVSPLMQKESCESYLLSGHLKALLLESYGSGTVPLKPWFLNSLKKLIDQGIPVLNITQCAGGTVEQGLYESSKRLEEIGVIGGLDLTREAALTKLMVLMGMKLKKEKIAKLLPVSLRGELSPLK
ncbi:MAG TPA: asparaginase [Bacteroidia bacterium]|nr:asparaginase [Bacteroidia bacterium]HNT79127.1 asparaginase [Bacteroidia bacterium]